MRIAFLILAHDEPELLARLVARLASPDADIFIHVDAKKDIAPFRKLIPGADFLDDRIRVNHGGFSLTKAMLALIEAAHRKGPYDIYQMLSGRDYPLKPVENIAAFYAGRPGTDFISLRELQPGGPMAQNIYQYHFVDRLAALPAGLRDIAVRVKNKLNRIKKRSFLPGMTPYRGSQWCALSGGTVKAVLKFLDTPSGEKYKNHFRFSWGSDEIFFQTLVMHLRASRIEDNLHYVDWDKTRENPAVLEESDFEKLQASAKLFARKMHPVKSAKLLERLDIGGIGGA